MHQWDVGPSVYKECSFPLIFINTRQTCLGLAGKKKKIQHICNNRKARKTKPRQTKCHLTIYNKTTRWHIVCISLSFKLLWPTGSKDPEIPRLGYISCLCKKKKKWIKKYQNIKDIIRNTQFIFNTKLEFSYWTWKNSFTRVKKTWQNYDSLPNWTMSDEIKPVLK